MASGMRARAPGVCGAPRRPPRAGGRGEEKGGRASPDEVGAPRRLGLAAPPPQRQHARSARIRAVLLSCSGPPAERGASFIEAAQAAAARHPPFPPPRSRPRDGVPGQPHRRLVARLLRRRGRDGAQVRRAAAASAWAAAEPPNAGVRNCAPRAPPARRSWSLTLGHPLAHRRHAPVPPPPHPTYDLEQARCVRPPHGRRRRPLPFRAALDAARAQPRCRLS